MSAEGARAVGATAGVWERVNGSWLAETAMPAGRHRIGSFADTAVLVRGELDRRLRAAAEGHHHPHHPHAQDAGVLYTSILAARAGRLTGDGPATRTVLAAVERVRDHATVGCCWGTLAGHGAPSGLRLRRRSGNGDHAHAVLAIGRPMLAAKDQAAATALLRQEVMPLAPAAGQVAAAVSDLLAVDTALTEAGRVFADTDGARRYLPVRDWSRDPELAAVLVQWADRAGLPADEPAYVPAEPDLTRALRTLLQVGPAAWRQWCRLATWWNALVAASPTLPGAIRAARGGSSATVEPIDPISLVETLMPGAVDHLLAADMDQRARADVEEMFAAVVDQLAAQLEQAQWLSPQSTRHTVEALRRMRVDCGPSRLGEAERSGPRHGPFSATDLTHNLLHLASSRTRTGLEPPSRGSVGAATVNASYLRTENVVVVPAALLRPPFHDPDWAPARRYGALGALIAHEVVHLLDPAPAPAVTAGWQEEERAHLRALRERVARRLDGLALPGHPDLRTDGKAVAVEFFADVLGLQLARLALLGPTSQPGTVPRDSWATWSDMEQAWARMWRFHCTREHLQRTHPKAFHPHPRLRCDFAAEFARDGLLLAD